VNLENAILKNKLVEWGLTLVASTLICLKVQAPQSYHLPQNRTEAVHDYEYPYSIDKNATLYSELLSQGFDGQDVQQILKLAKPYYDLSKLPRGLRYRLIYANSPIISWGGLEFQLSPTKTLRFTLDQSAKWAVYQNELKVEVRLVSFVGSVRNSLWESARLAKMNPQLIAQLTEIFGWELDFSRQVTDNDSWRLTVEQQLANGRVVGWGRILAAEYKNNLVTYSAVYFEKPGRIRGYFDLEGQSLAKSFLRSPIEFARISSGFSMRRFHPKLKIFRPHLGVDYAAAKGTPVRALGDGSVLEARYSGGGGNTVALAHGGTYKTRYLHLSGFASKIRAGAIVKQGQVIGYVGSTGLSTGPHLHFEFYQNNHYVDPLKVDLPASASVPEELLAEFETHSAQRVSQLPPLPRNVATN
jgi:murein DD-endopeptidase MepM/ murein hydrolase activator NlpD